MVFGPGRENSRPAEEIERQAKNPITCEGCKTIYRGRPDCPKCGKIPVKKGQALKFVEGELGRVERDGSFQSHKFTKYQMERFFRELKFIENERGYKPGWKYHKYKERFGLSPRNISDVAIEPGPETRSYIRKQAIAYAKEQREKRAN